MMLFMPGKTPSITFLTSIILGAKSVSSGPLTAAILDTKSVIKQFLIRDHLLKVARRSDNVDDWANNYRTARNKAVSALR